MSRNRKRGAEARQRIEPRQPTRTADYRADQIREGKERMKAEGLTEPRPNNQRGNHG